MTTMPATVDVPTSYLGFVGLTLLNPLTVVYFAALVIGRHAPVFSTPTAAAGR